jgi:microsomal dipeptidase-like Zn-dependent dipeptidase
MKYFDFHCHPILKQLFNDDPNIDTFIYKKDLGIVPKACSELGEIIQTQTHHIQLAEFKDEVIVGAVLYSVEKYVAKNVIPLRGNLKKSSQFKLSKTLLENIDNNIYKAFSGFLMERTLEEYIQASSYNILTKASFKNPLPKNKVNVFFTIEGCHSLVDTINECNSTQSYDVNEIITNLDTVRDKVKVISVNLTHLQQSSLCNHAFGMQVAKIEPFIPKGNGLQNDGKKVVQELFNRNICVDVKHMSYKSRKDLMMNIDAKKFDKIQPLVCTHTGFTGISFKKWTGYIDFKKQVFGAMALDLAKPIDNNINSERWGLPAFNASTINLFDEEIAWMVKNNGVIGLSLDKRILGYIDDISGKGLDETLTDREYFSIDEWDILGLNNDKNFGELISDENCLNVDEFTQSQQNWENFYYSHILNHLKHYFKVCLANGISIETAQKHITIGTDYDGLINPFDVTSTVSDIGKLRSHISLNFRYFLEESDDSKAWANQINMDTFMENLFYWNGYNFIKSRFEI